MTKPNFQTMTRKELKTYLMSHRDDEEGWRIFFDKTEAEKNPNAKVFSADVPMDEMKQIILEKIRENQQQKSE